MSVDRRDMADELGKWEVQVRKGGLGQAGRSIPEGTIYPLLSRMKAEGLVDAEWVEADAGHPRKYYRLTDPGRARVREMAASWRAFGGGLERRRPRLAAAC